MAIQEKHYPDMQRAAEDLAVRMAANLRDAIATKGHASLAVSGGRTPKQVFAKLRELDVDWAKVTVTLIDERWVPNDHADSNEALARNFLLQGAADKATFVPMYGGEETPMAGQAACEKRLQEVPLPFDASYLGMGPDGHFASLFPGDPAVHVTEGLCVAVQETEGRVARMSLTAPAVLNSENVYLLLSGDEKKAKYEKAKTPGPAKDVPLRLLLLQNDVTIHVLMAP